MLNRHAILEGLLACDRDGNKMESISFTLLQTCSFDACPVDCQMSEWSPWSCDARSKCVPGVAVATGTSTRTRTVKVQPQNRGQACGATVDTQVLSESAIEI